MIGAGDPDVLLVGAGPAGCSAALWLRDFGVPFLWVDKGSTPGGTLHRVHNRIENLPGKNYPNGSALVEEIQAQLQALSLSPLQKTLQSMEISSEEGAVKVRFENRESVKVRRVLLATGTSYRTLGVPGEAEFLGTLISQSSARDGHRARGLEVAVVGGGDAAFENALRLAAVDAKVTLLLRSSPRARPEFLEEVRANPSIQIAPIPSEVKRISKLQGASEGLRLEFHSERSSPLEVGMLFIRIGVAPSLPEGISHISKDSEGYLITDQEGRTSSPLLYGAGDLVSAPLRAIATAYGAGAIAARSIARDLKYL